MTDDVSEDLQCGMHTASEYPTDFKTNKDIKKYKNKIFKLVISKQSQIENVQKTDSLVWSNKNTVIWT